MYIFEFFRSIVFISPCLLENQSNVDKDKTYMKMEWKKGRGMCHQRRIQNLVKHLSCKSVFAKIVSGWKSSRYFCKRLHHWCLTEFWIASGHYTDSLKLLIHNQIRLIKFIESNKFDNVNNKILTHFCLIKSVGSNF